MRPELEIAQYGAALLLLGLAVALTAGMMALSHLISPHNPTPEKQLTYECGEDPIGSAWLRFNIRFYIVALVFVLFDVEVALVYPVAPLFKMYTENATTLLPALIILGEVLVFLGVLLLGLIYVWRKGDLGWVRTFRAPAGTGLQSWKVTGAAPRVPKPEATPVARS